MEDLFMFDMPNRAELKQQARELLQTAQVSPKGLTALYCGLTLVLNLLDYFAGSLIPGGAPEVLTTFVSIFTNLAGWILAAGFTLYCMGIRRHEVTEYGTLFDGFSFTGKIIALNFVMSFFILLWSMLFVVPGIIAYYRYSFALYNLYDNPGLNIMEALEMSKQQTRGWKLELLKLDLSYLGWALLSLLPALYVDGTCRPWGIPPPFSPLAPPCRRSWCAACGPWRCPCSSCPITSASAWITSMPPRPLCPAAGPSGTAVPTIWGARLRRLFSAFSAPAGPARRGGSFTCRLEVRHADLSHGGAGLLTFI